MSSKASVPFRWRKLGRIFDPTAITGTPWMREFAQGPCALIFEKFVRVYFSCRPSPDHNGQYVSYSAFVDLNRKDLFEIVGISTKPILELGGKGTFDEFGTYPVSVIRRGSDVLAYYGGWTRCDSVPFDVAIGLAISEDNGETFTRLGSGPVLSTSLWEPFILSGPKIRYINGVWHLWYIAGKRWIHSAGRFEPVYKIRKAHSTDGIHWLRENRDLIPDKLGDDEAQASPDVFFYKNLYHMFFCYRHGTDYRGARGYRIGYASSSDLIHWTRNDTMAGIDVSASGWDSETISYPHVFELDGQIYMFYLGNQVGRHGFGLAQLETQ